MYVLEDLWGDKVNPQEKGFPSRQYARAMRQDAANKVGSLLSVAS